ncbi:MAG: ParA family protein [Syntrophales bacterium]|nr:ParA family protein [Syntrophales bacterium]
MVGNKKVLAVWNLKGGVGKTTCTVNIGVALGILGKKVLLIDMDPQAHLAYALGISSLQMKCSILHFLEGSVPWREILVLKEGVWVIPSSSDHFFDGFLSRSAPEDEVILRERISGITGFDFVLIDCPPAWNVLTVNALVAASDLLVPIQVEFMALKSLGRLFAFVEEVKRRHNGDLKIGGIIGNRYDGRKKLDRKMVESLNRRFGGMVFSTLIRENVKIAEAAGYGQSIFLYAPKSRGARDFLALAREIVSHKSFAVEKKPDMD